MVARAAQTITLTVVGGLLGLWFLQPVPAVLVIFHAAFLVLAATRPAVALVVFAALGPLSTSIGEIASSQMAGSRHLEALVLSLVIGGVLRWRPGDATRTGLPALLFGTVCLVSAAAIYPTLILQAFPDEAVSTVLSELGRDYFLRSPFADPLFFAALAMEGAALVWIVESLCRRVSGLTAWVVSAALAGHTVVALVNIQRLVNAATRRDNFPASIVDMFTTVRVSSQYDVNAAASVFVLVGLASVGLWTWRRAIWQVPAAGLLATGVWLTGSRVAMAAAAGMTLVTLASSAIGASRRALWPIVGGAAVVLAGAAAVVSLYPQGRNLNVAASVESRAILFRAGMGMVRDAPVFGMGVGRFLDESDRYGASDIGAILGARGDGVIPRRENAHNNFLQVMAELGIVGFSALAWLLVASVAGGLWRIRQLDAHHRWLLAGLAASMLTWLTGHPLLVAEASMMFWLFAGLAASRGPVSVRPPALRALVGLVLAGLAVSLPWQASGHRNRAELEHLGRGLSDWHFTDTGQRFRESGRDFSLFLPAGQLVTLPLRTVPGQLFPVGLTLLVDGRRVDRIVAGVDDWLMYRFRVPDGPGLFVEVRFVGESTTGPALSCDRCVQIGKQIVRPTPGV